MQYTSKFSGEEIDSILDSVRDKQDAIPDLETIRSNAKNASDTIARMVESGYLFAGIATIDTNPGIPDAKVFYIANGKGKYEKFGGIEVTEDEVVVLYWDSAWHKVATGIASQAKLSELEQNTSIELNTLDNKIKMGFEVEDILPQISNSFVPHKYPVYSNGAITTSGSSNPVGYYIIPLDLLQNYFSINAYLQCDGPNPAAIAFYSSDSDFGVDTYLEGVQHKNTTGEWFEAKIPSNAKACLITNRKTTTNGADPVVLTLKKEGLIASVDNIENEIAGPASYQEEHLGDIVLSPITTIGSIKIDCKYGDVIKVVADANVNSFALGTKRYGTEVLNVVSGNQTLYIILKEKVANLFAYSVVNNSLQRTISVYKCAKKELYEYPNLVGSFFRYYTPTIGKDNWMIGKSAVVDGTTISDNKRATTGFLNWTNPSIRVSVSDTVNFRFYILGNLKGGASNSGWMTSYEKDIECESLAITLEKTNGENLTEDDLNVISVEFLEPVIESYVGEKDFKELDLRVEELSKQNEFNLIGSVNNILNVNKPYYYHFSPDSFIIDGDGKRAIPSQTSYDIELASRLGFTSIEVNIHATADGNFICMHGSGGNFGSTVLSLDGSDISATSIGTKTLQWIKNNVRFKSYYEKYKVAPLSLEEFCSSCRSNGIGILAGTDNINAINTCVRMLGTDNVMLYNARADRRSIFKGMMFVWDNSTSTTIDNILTTARSYGLPFMYGLGPSLLSALVANNQLSELCSKMHAEGFTLASTAVYDTDENTLNAFQQGVDFSASGHQVNNFEPNYFIHSLDSTGISGTAAINDGMSNMTAGQTIICGKEEIITGKAILNIRYNGTLAFHFGSVGNRTLTSDGSKDVVLSDYFFKKSSKLVITAQTDATISNMVYKTSIC